MTFPDQIMVDIVTRLPAKEVFKFKIVSKAWNSLISSPYFIKTFLSRSPPDWRILDRVVQVQLTGSTHFNLPSPPQVGYLTATPPISFNVNPTFKTTPKVISASNGLVLMSSTTSEEQDTLFVLNPITRECSQLPKPGDPITSVESLGFSARVNELTQVIESFFVVEYRPLLGNNIGSVLVFSSEKWRWEEIWGGYYMLGDHVWLSHVAFEIDGRLFWTDLSCGIIYSEEDVQRWNEDGKRWSDMKFGYIGLPKECKRGLDTSLMNSRHIGVVRDGRGERCVQFMEVELEKRVVKLWRLKDYKRGKWTVVYKAPFEERGWDFVPEPLFFNPFKADIVYCLLGGELVILDLRTMEITYRGSYTNSLGVFLMTTVEIPSWPYAFLHQSPEAAKERGNEYFKEKKYEAAIHWYSKSIMRSPTAVAYANRAAAYLNLRNFQEAENDSTEALKLDAHFMKAYWRRVVARKELGKLGEALEDAEHALNLNPHHREMQKLCDELKSLL